MRVCIDNNIMQCTYIILNILLNEQNETALLRYTLSDYILWWNAYIVLYRVNNI